VEEITVSVLPDYVASKLAQIAPKRLIATGKYCQGIYN